MLNAQNGKKKMKKKRILNIVLDSAIVKLTREYKTAWFEEHECEPKVTHPHSFSQSVTRFSFNLIPF